MDKQQSSPDRLPPKKRLSRKKLIKYSLILMFVAFIISISAITYKFGPYMGKVVDLETGTPLEGAVVLICFRTDSFESSGSYAGAIETMTDVNGEFKILAKRFFVFHPLSEWNPNGYVTIFKPGYGVYPGHDDSVPMFVPNGTIPQNEYITIRLPKLRTIDERKKIYVEFGRVVPFRIKKQKIC